ncbi:MAG: pyruvate kinase [Nitrospirae bacterium]|nr:MAG: pyruvate kinase [Nitrospirota bacterium]
MGKAKIVCTIGPSSNSRKVVHSLIKNGMDVARLNFSHGEHGTHRKAASLIRQEAKKLGRTIAILQDLQGIKIRITAITGNEFLLKTGQEINLRPGIKPGDQSTLYITYPALLKDVRKGDRILIDDGLIKLAVTAKTDSYLRAKVIEGGMLKSKKGVNFPTTKTTLAAFTEKDRADLELGIGLGVDYVAISFVRTPEDIAAVQNWAKRKGLKLPPIIAKIEKPEALENINAIMDMVDGIMVARGDLGVEMPTEQVPIIQKMLIDLANKKGKLVITATQMLESMTLHTRPTRAEASDVANAVLDGTDALMLSGETAAGKYPVEAVAMMRKIISSTETDLIDRIQSPYRPGGIFPEAIADGAVKAAVDIDAKAIVVFSHSGFTAKLLSKLKPYVPIVAFTPDETALKRMVLYWGVIPKLMSRGKVEMLNSAFMAQIEATMLKDKLVARGDNIVFVASSAFLGKTNIIRLHRI